MKEIVVIAHDMRSIFNVGSLFRTADGLGVSKLYLTGYTPYPEIHGDERLPHIRQKITAQIHKTALGAELTVPFVYIEDVKTVVAQLKSNGYHIVALEQVPQAKELHTYKTPEKTALLLGTEVTGIPNELLQLCDDCVVIPMFGKKESFNVIQATAMALFQLRFYA